MMEGNTGQQPRMSVKGNDWMQDYFLAYEFYGKRVGI